MNYIETMLLQRSGVSIPWGNKAEIVIAILGGKLPF